MTAISNTQTYTLKLGKSKLLLTSIVKRHNTVHPLRTRIRAAHVCLMEKLLWLYSSHLNTVQAYGDGIKEGQALPPLRTNGVQLAGLMCCSERTVRNLVARLINSGLVVSKVFKGSNSSYELHLSLSTLHLERRAMGPDNCAPAFAEGAAPTLFSIASGKSLPHTVTSKEQVTKELNKLGGADFEQAGAALGFAGNLGVDNLPEGVQNLGKLVENLRPGSGRDTKPATQKTGYEHAGTGPVTAPPVAAPPPGGDHQNDDTRSMDVPARLLPDTLEEVLHGLSEADADSITRHVAVMWTAALHQLYPDRWISESEADRARAALAEYLRWARPERYSLGADEVLERITLVRRWLERGKAENKKRWVPLPSGYFDHRNATGFQATKPWFKKHIKAKSDIKSKELLTKALKQYMRSLDPTSQTSPTETYRIISQRLGKYSKDLAQDFNRQVAGIAQQQQVSN